MSTTDTSNQNTEVDAWAAKINRLRNRKPMERAVTFHDEEAAEIADAAREALKRAEKRARSEVVAHLEPEQITTEIVAAGISADAAVIENRAAVVEAERGQADAAVILRVRALGSDVYVELQAEFPPTSQQEKEGQEYDVTKFAPALVSACSVDDVSVKQAAHLLGGQYPVLGSDGAETGRWKSVPSTLNQGEAALLFTTCVGVNQGSRATLGKA